MLARRLARRRQRAEQQPAADRDRCQRDGAEGERQPSQLVVEGHAPLRPREQVERLTQHGRRLGPPTRHGPDEERPDRADGAEDGHEAPERGAQAERRLPHAERVARPPQEPGRAKRQRRLLEVEALEEVDDAEAEQQGERDVAGAPPPPLQVDGRDDQRRRRGNGERVEERQGADGLRGEQEVAAPADVGRQGRAEVDDPDRERDGAGERGQALALLQSPGAGEHGHIPAERA
jgi:hypothetical protein